jgi:RimJ/RimL family protein N-acetyltransferase
MNYKLQTAKLAILKNPLIGVLTAYRIVRAKVVGARRPMFTLTGSDIGKVPVIEIPDYRIECFSTWPDMSCSLQKELSQNRNYLEWDNAEKLFEQGGKLWVGRLCGQLANVGWSRQGNMVHLWFFPLTPTWYVISHCVTLPEFRGLGLYPAMLSYIAHTLCSQGAERFFIDCSDWNLSSIQGIKKVGFQKIGYGVHKRNGRLIWYQAARPDSTINNP